MIIVPAKTCHPVLEIRCFVDSVMCDILLCGLHGLCCMNLINERVRIADQMTQTLCD